MSSCFVLAIFTLFRYRFGLTEEKGVGGGRFSRSGDGKQRGAGFPTPPFNPDATETARIIAHYHRKRAEIAAASQALRSQMVLGGRGDYPHPPFNPDPMKSPVIRKMVADERGRQEDAAAARLLPANRYTDALGKVWASPFTAVGSIVGAANVAAAKIAGDERARISVSDNGIQFESGYLGKGKQAFTLGNAVLHAPGSQAISPNNRYDGQGTNANTAEHESGHTYRYQKPGFVADYVRYLVRELLTKQRNPYEDEADDFGDWKYRQRQSGW